MTVVEMEPQARYRTSARLSDDDLVEMALAVKDGRIVGDGEAATSYRTAYMRARSAAERVGALGLLSGPPTRKVWRIADLEEPVGDGVVEVTEQWQWAIGPPEKLVDPLAHMPASIPFPDPV